MKSNTKLEEVKTPSADLTTEFVNGVLVVRFDDSQAKVNTLSSRLTPQFEVVLKKAETEKAIKALVLTSAKPDCFVAGADIKELQSLKTEADVKKLSRKGQELFNRLERLKKPTVAAINGACLGGGLELALACDYRIATTSKSTVLGLPEVMLGLLPGAGGTQRLPRLIGLEKALDLILTGKSLKAERAFKMGLVNYVCQPEALEQIACQAALRLADKKLPSQVKQRMTVPYVLSQVKFGRDIIFQQATKTVLAKTKGVYPAPLAIIKVIAHGLDHGMKKGLEKEATEFARLSQTKESNGLISLYFAQTETKKNPYGKLDTPVKTLGVLGAGLMGAGIGFVSISKDMKVLLKDANDQGVARGEKYIWDIFASRVRRRALSKFQAQQVFSKLKGQTDYSQFENADLVIEAVFEDLDLKHQVLKATEAVMKEGAIFASNTSALPISEIAKASKHPENVLGMHYFSPVHKMPLLEIIKTEKTSDRAVQIAYDTGLKQGKTVIVVEDGPGFYTTRILGPFMDEGALLVCEGLHFKKLDTYMQEFGFPVGPITLIDEVGIDVAYHVGHDLGKALGKRVTSQDPKALKDLVDLKILGKKTKQGFYIYNPPQNKLASMVSKRPSKTPNPKVLEVLNKHKVTPLHKHQKEEIQHRMAFRMINEAVLCLQEGVIKRPLDGDIGAVFGLGFPPFMGGPFRYCDQLGLKKVVKIMTKLQDRYGERFTPCKLLKEMALSNKTFY